ncbi:hypothetical protein GCM10027081_32950 [Cupriavidus yeoncheonensis]
MRCGFDAAGLPYEQRVAKPLFHFRQGLRDRRLRDVQGVGHTSHLPVFLQCHYQTEMTQLQTGTKKTYGIHG